MNADRLYITLNKCIGLARQVRYSIGWVAVTDQRTLESSQYMRGEVWYFCGVRSVRSRGVTSVDTVRVDVVAGEHLCYGKYVKYCISSDKIPAMVNVINYAYFHVQCKRRTLAVHSEP